MRDRSDDLVIDCSELLGQFVGGDLFIALPADNHRIIADRDLASHGGDVDQALIHRDTTDLGTAHAAHQQVAVVRETSAKAVIAGSILEGLDETVPVIRFGVPGQLRRALACASAIENALGTVRTVSRNVIRWRNAELEDGDLPDI